MTKIENEYAAILKDCSAIGKVVILALTALLYVVHSKPFLFVFYGLLTYPFAFFYYVKGADAFVFFGTALIHFITLELSCAIWPEREKELKHFQEAINFMIKKGKHRECTTN